MINEVPINLLKPHPKNQEYYDDLTGEKYEEVRRSIVVNGIRDPLKVLPDYTVVAGHQRLRAAKELEMEKVPVVILNLSLEEAEYLLIADNEERRQGDDDPMKKARRAKFLKEYWGVKRGGDQKSKRQNVALKTAADVAKAIDEDERTTQRLLKLTDLIPEFQALVSQKKLGTTAANLIAGMTHEEQKTLWKTLGEAVTNLKVPEIKELKEEAQQYRKRVNELETQLERARKQVEQNGNSEEAQAAIRFAQEQIDQLKTQLGSKEKSLKKAWEEKRRAIQEKDDAERRAREAELELQRVKQTYETVGVSKEQCNIADQIEELLISTRKELVGFIELIDLKSLPKERCLHLCTGITKLNIVTSTFREEIEKAEKGNSNIAIFKKN